MALAISTSEAVPVTVTFLPSTLQSTDTTPGTLDTTAVTARTQPWQVIATFHSVTVGSAVCSADFVVKILA
jgi:hypothetical protein